MLFSIAHLAVIFVPNRARIYLKKYWLIVFTPRWPGTDIHPTQVKRLSSKLTLVFSSAHALVKPDQQTITIKT
jgi:hypothetical protein